jgi:hypothetical protein
VTKHSKVGDDASFKTNEEDLDSSDGEWDDLPPLPNVIGARSVTVRYLKRSLFQLQTYDSFLILYFRNYHLLYSEVTACW